MDRGLFVGLECETLREKVGTQPYAKLWDYLVSRWEGVVERCGEEGKTFDLGSLGWFGITPMVVEAAAIYRLTGRVDAKDYALSCIEDLLTTYDGFAVSEDSEKDMSNVMGLLMRPKVLSHGEVAMAADLLQAALPEEMRFSLLKLMKTICIPFTSFDKALAGYSSGGNVSACRNINAGICALLWGEESGYDGWETVVNQACDNVRQFLRNGCDEEGFPYEGTGYGSEVMQFIFLFCFLLRSSGWEDDLLKTEPRLRKVPDAYQYMILPDGRFCATTNDQGIRLPASLWWMLLLGEEYNRPDYLGVWEHFSGPEHPIRPWGDCWPEWERLFGGDPRTINKADKSLLLTFLLWEADSPVVPIERSPLPTSICSQGTGTATFRTSWNKTAVFAAMLGGGRSRACLSGHVHADCGHINLAIGGEYIAVDTGRYNWPEDQHSLVLIDGKPTRSAGETDGMGGDYIKGELGQFQHCDLLDFCVSDSTSIKRVPWAQRGFLFIRGKGDDAYVVLLDNINVDNGAKSHEFWWQLQCATSTTIEFTGETSATVKGEQARIDCDFLQKPDPVRPDAPHRISLRRDEKEWVWPYGHDQNPKEVACLERTGESTSSVRRPRLLAVQESLGCMMLSVLSPRREGQECRQVKQINITNGIAVEVTGDGFADTILTAPDHKLILTDECKCFSEYAVIRRDKDGNIIDTWTQSGEPIQWGRG